MLHKITKYLYKLSKNIFGLQVLTENGFEDITSVNITMPTETIQVKTRSYNLICSRKHIFIMNDGTEVYAEDSLGKKIFTINGKAEEILSITESDKQELYDISMADGTSHTYFVNGLLSHNCVIADEFSFVPNNIASKVFESIYPVISSSKNSQFIIVSTPNGADPNNLYYDIWQKANSKSKGNAEGWKAFRFDWWDVPGRDEQWKQNTIASIGVTRFAQEFGNEFLSTTGSKRLIPEDVLERLRIKCSKAKQNGFKSKKQKILAETEDKVFEFDMWHEFNSTRAYLASADIAEGVGGDSSVLYIWDVTEMSNIMLCAKFSSNEVSLVEFAFVASKILNLYAQPYLFAERNGVSAGMLDSLRVTYKYSKIAAESKNNEPGIYSHVSVKCKSCLDARELVITDGFDFQIYDEDLLDEFGSFVKKDTKGVHTVYQAATGAHDDHVMAFIWMCFALQNERIDKYFHVCKTFTSVLGQIYPSVLQPLDPVTNKDIQKIMNDPIYKTFIEYKNECLHKNMVATINIEHENKYDPYFGYASEPDWNDTMPKSVNPNNYMPVFFIN